MAKKNARLTLGVEWSHVATLEVFCEAGPGSIWVKLGQNSWSVTPDLISLDPSVSPDSYGFCSSDSSLVPQHVISLIIANYGL